MSTYRVFPSKIKGELKIPPSKSQTLRAILFAALAKGESVIEDPLLSPDTEAMIRASLSFGAKVKREKERLTITGVSGKVGRFQGAVDAGNSGIVLRFISAVGALSPYPFVITGDHSIQTSRKMQPLIDALKSLGVKCESLAGRGFAPLSIQGGLRGGEVTVEGSDSQPVSALLIALSLAKGSSLLKVLNPGEIPWVELTLDWLKRLRLNFERKSPFEFWIEGGGVIEPFTYRVPGDLSTLSFPLAASLVSGGEVKVSNVDLNDPQGDKLFLDLLVSMGALVLIDKGTVSLKNRASLKGVTVDINPFIDAVPIVSTLGCYATGETVILGAQNAKNKESNRLLSMSEELSKMGGEIEVFSDGLKIHPRKLQGAILESHNDHRVAMSLVVAALGAEGPSLIHGVQCIEKTFPNFLKTFSSLGAHIEVI